MGPSSTKKKQRGSGCIYRGAERRTTEEETESVGWSRVASGIGGRRWRVEAKCHVDAQ
jgi:hypothetical protein